MPPVVNGDNAGPSTKADDLVATTKKRNRPQYHPFTQQKLPACKPILAPHMVIPVLVFVGLIFIPIGLACIAASNKVVEVVDRYDTKCVPGNMLHNQVAYIQNASIDKSCTRILKVPRDMKQPIYIYYQLDKFYQNHRIYNKSRYAKSRSDMQLKDPKEADDTQFCKPEATANGIPVVPCGLIAWSLFNDTYSFAHRGDKPLRVIKRGISWESERDHMFGKHMYTKNFQNGSLGAEQAGVFDGLDADGGAADVQEAVREDRGGPPCPRAGHGFGTEQLQLVQLRREEGVHGRVAGREERLPGPRVRRRRRGLLPARAAAHAALRRLPHERGASSAASRRAMNTPLILIGDCS